MNKQKHLEFIQTVISRMSANLFMLKGWSITIIVAILTFLVKDTNGIYLLFSFFVIFIFWILDGFFLSKERCFRGLYNQVRLKKEKDIDYSMNYSDFNKGKNTWIRSIFSTTLAIFYGSLLTITILIAIVININSIKIEVGIKNNKVKNYYLRNHNFELKNINERNHEKSVF